MVKDLSNFISNNRKRLFGLWILVFGAIILSLKPIQIDASLNETAIKGNTYHQAMLDMDSLFGRQADIAIKVIPEKIAFAQFDRGFSKLQSTLKQNFQGAKIISPFGSLKGFIDKSNSVQNLLKQFTALPLLQDLISKDSSSFLVLVQLPKNAMVSAKEISNILSQNYLGLKALKSFSLIELENQIEKSLVRDLVLLSIAILVFFSIILLLAFRSWQSIFFCLAIALPSVLLAIACFSFFDSNLNLITLIVIPICIVLALADAVHLLTGYSSGKNKNLDKKSRLKSSIQNYIFPSFLTSLSTSIAFYSFVFNESENLQNLGLITGTTVLGGFFLTYFLGPFLLGIVPFSDLSNHPFSKLSIHFAKRKKLYSGSLILLFLVSIFFTNSIEFKTSFTNFFPKNSEVLKNHNELEKDFYSQLKLNLLINRKDPNKGSKKELMNWVEKVSKGIQSYKWAGKVNYHPNLKNKNSGAIPLLFNLNARVSEMLNFSSADGNTHRIEIRFPSPNHIKLFEREFLSHYKTKDLNYKVSFASPALVMEAIDKSTATSLLKSLSFSSLFILLVIGLMSKSLRITFYSLIANLAPLSAILVLFWIFDLKINVLTSITSVVCLGLIVDDTLHVIYRKVNLNEDLEELGFGMILTSSLLAGGFLLFNLSSFTPTQTFGNISAAIFIITLISDLTLLPLLIGTRKNKK